MMWSHPTRFGAVRDNPHKVQTMWPVVLAFGLIMLVMTWAFDHLIERRRNPNLSLINQGESSGRVVLQRNRYGSYIAPGRINGQTVTFLVDTGASTVALPAAVADELGLERGPAFSVNTAAGTTRAFQTWIDSIVIGGIRIDNVRGMITPAMTGDDVLLGMTFLRHVDFSQQGDELVIEAFPSAR